VQSGKLIKNVSNGHSVSLSLSMKSVSKNSLLPEDGDTVFLRNSDTQPSHLCPQQCRNAVFANNLRKLSLQQFKN